MKMYSKRHIEGGDKFKLNWMDLKTQTPASYVNNFFCLLFGVM